MNTQKPSPESPSSLKKPQEKQLQNGLPKEYGGFANEGLKEPTRYGDWDVRGRCSDF